MPSHEFRVPVICGPTAAGKSAIAMWLAHRHDITIISADSRQVYRGFDIGTAKPSVAERRETPHKGIDVADPRDRYSAAAWAQMAGEAIRQAPNSKRQTVVVGGTGFYINALFQPLWSEPDFDPEARKAIQDSLVGVPLDELRRWCERLDPARAHLGRTQLLRAIEVALLTGKRLSEMHDSHARPSEFRGRYLVVDPGPVLAGQIALRVESMLQAGWVEEVRTLMDTVPSDAPAWNASGYRSMRAHVEGTLDRAAVVEHVIVETRQYAKRQRTWFRHQLPDEDTTRVSPNDDDWKDVVEAWFSEVRRPMSEVR